jgi:uncharacterized protein YegP (UPF0339 family)
MKVQLFKNKRRQWQVRLVARNGRKLMVSESYSRKRGALHCAMLIVAGRKSIVLEELYK